MPIRKKESICSVKKTFELSSRSPITVLTSQSKQTWTHTQQHGVSIFILIGVRSDEGAHSQQDNAHGKGTEHVRRADHHGSNLSKQHHQNNSKTSAWESLLHVTRKYS